MAIDKALNSPTKPKTKNKGGRPTTYTPEIANKICERLAMGESMRTVCKPEGMPSMASVFNWLNKHEEFLDQYTRAKQESADAMAEDILDIADNGTNDWTTKTGKNGTEYDVVDNDVIQRSRLRVETRKWLMAKMKPKKYGDRLDLTSGGDKIDRGMTIEEINAVLARAEEAKKHNGKPTKVDAAKAT